MCLATPMQLNRIDGDYGFVEHGGKEYQVELSLIENPKVGDWIFAHGKIAVSRISGKDAQEILQLIDQANHGH